MPARARSPRHLLACIALLLGVGCVPAPAHALAAAPTLAPAADAADPATNNPRAPIPLTASSKTQPWRARLLWAFDMMDTATAGRARGGKVPALIDLRLTRHQRLAHGWTATGMSI